MAIKHTDPDFTKHQDNAFAAQCQPLTLPNDKSLHWSKLKAFQDDKKNVTENLKFVWGHVENIAGKGENAGFQHLLLFPNVFKRFLLQGLYKL